MRFGLFYQHQLPRPWLDGGEEKMFRDALEQIELADRLGFHSTWLVEHHFLEEYSHSSAPEVFLAAASQRTSRIRLGHGIVQLPAEINQPARVAERISTLDLISGGRVEFGIGEGNSQMELGAFAIERELKKARSEESLDAITRMFVEEPFAGYQGRWVRMPPRNVIPKPKQKPHPPLWMACSRRQSIATAARKGLGALSFSFLEPEEAREWVDTYYRLIASEECVPAGFAVNPRFAIVVPFLCHESEDEAIARGLEGSRFFGYSLGHYFVFGKHQPGHTSIAEEFERLRDLYGFSRDIVRAEDAPPPLKLLQLDFGSVRGAIGTPAQIHDLLRRYQRAGVDDVLFIAQAGPNRHEHVCQSLELFARDVLPCFAAQSEPPARARLAEACERALKRRPPPCQAPPDYVVTPWREGTPRNLSVIGRFVRRRSDRQLERILSFGPVLRLTLKGIERGFHPQEAAGLSGTIACEFTAGGVARHWHVEISAGRARARPGKAKNPLFTFRATLAVLARIAAGELEPETAVLQKKVEVEGDMKALMRFNHAFYLRG